MVVSFQLQLDLDLVSKPEETIERPAASFALDAGTGRAWLEFSGRPSEAVSAELKRDGWRWSPYRKAWHNARRGILPPASVSYVDAGKVSYAEERAERLGARSEKLAGKAAEHLGASHRITGAIPFGQPILVGHHSEKRHRAALAKSHAHMDKGLAAHKEAQDLAEKAERSARLQAAKKEDLGMAARRLERLRAENAKIARYAPEERLQRIYALNAEEIAVLEDRLKSGPQRAEIHPGDIVKSRGRLRLVERVSNKSFSCFELSPGVYGWPSKVEYTWGYEIVQPANPASLQALEMRKKTKGQFAPAGFEELIGKALKG